jgi:hypothetical protein
MPKQIKPEHYFGLCSGILIKDIKELAFALDYISDGELNHHVNQSRNDFSRWIRDVFEEKQLADDVAKAKDRKELQIMLLKFLVKNP